MVAVVLSILPTTMSMARSEARCHIYKVWKYPKPQRCFVALAKSNRYAQRFNDTKPASREPETSREQHEQITIPLPMLDFEACQDGDERLQGIARLRALSDGPAP